MVVSAAVEHHSPQVAIITRPRRLSLALRDLHGLHLGLQVRELAAEVVELLGQLLVSALSARTFALSACVGAHLRPGDYIEFAPFAALPLEMPFEGWHVTSRRMTQP